MDPFTNATTIASMCMAIYKLHYLKPETIGVIPHGGYRKNERQSLTAIKWLKWISESQDLDIQHARNGQEVTLLMFIFLLLLLSSFQVTIGKYKLDGQLRTDHTQLYEFNGCPFHGCPKCFKNRHTRLPMSDMTAQGAYEQTIAKERYLTALGW